MNEGMIFNFVAQSALCERWYQWKPTVQTSYALPCYAEMLWIREGLSIDWIHQASNQYQTWIIVQLSLTSWFWKRLLSLRVLDLIQYHEGYTYHCFFLFYKQKIVVFLFYFSPWFLAKAPYLFIPSISWQIRCWEVKENGQTIPKAQQSHTGPILSCCWHDVRETFFELF